MGGNYKCKSRGETYRARIDFTYAVILVMSFTRSATRLTALLRGNFKIVTEAI